MRPSTSAGRHLHRDRRAWVVLPGAITSLAGLAAPAGRRPCRQLDGQGWARWHRDRAGRIVARNATRLDLAGRSTHPAPSAIAERATGSWHSNVTAITYSSGYTEFNSPGQS